MSSMFDGKSVFSPHGTAIFRVENGQVKAMDGSLVARIEGDRINDPFGGILYRLRSGAEGKTEVTDPLGGLVNRITSSGFIEDGPGGRIGFLK